MKRKLHILGLLAILIVILSIFFVSCSPSSNDPSGVFEAAEEAMHDYKKESDVPGTDGAYVFDRWQEEGEYTREAVYYKCVACASQGYIRTGDTYRTDGRKFRVLGVSSRGVKLDEIPDDGHAMHTLICPEPLSAAFQEGVAAALEENLPTCHDVPRDEYVHADATSGVIETLDLRGTFEGRVLGLDTIDIIAYESDPYIENGIEKDGSVQPVLSSDRLPAGFRAVRSYATCNPNVNRFPKTPQEIQKSNEDFACQIAILRVEGEGAGILRVDRKIVFGSDLRSFDMQLGSCSKR